MDAILNNEQLRLMFLFLICKKMESVLLRPRVATSGMDVTKGWGPRGQSSLGWSRAALYNSW
jgi:hypothetical protein